MCPIQRHCLVDPSGVLQLKKRNRAYQIGEEEEQVQAGERYRERWAEMQLKGMSYR